MHQLRDTRPFAVFFSLALHAVVFALASNYQFGFSSKNLEDPKPEIVFLELIPPPEPPPTKVEPPTGPLDQSISQTADIAQPTSTSFTEPVSEKRSSTCILCY